MKGRVLSLSLACLLFLALVGMECNVPGLLGLGKIGSEGGTVALVDRDGKVLASVEIPPGALDEDTPISIVPLNGFVPPEFADDPDTACLLGEIWQFLPEGLTFGEPVDVVLFISDEDLGASDPDDLIIITTPLDGRQAGLAPAAIEFDSAGGTASPAGGGIQRPWDDQPLLAVRDRVGVLPRAELAMIGGDRRAPIPRGSGPGGQEIAFAAGEPPVRRYVVSPLSSYVTVM